MDHTPTPERTTVQRATSRREQTPAGEPSTSHRMCSGRRALLLVAMLVAIVLGTSATAQAATYLGSSGTVGPVYGYGGTVCNPYVSGGYAKYRIEIGSPLAEENRQVAPAGYSVVGGVQLIKWQPWLEKYVNGQWKTVWVGDWYSRNSYSSITSFGDPFVDIRYLGSYSGAGYYRTGGTLWWVADASHAGGWVQYRHSTGNYFVNGYVDSTGAHATPVSTAYCYAG